MSRTLLDYKGYRGAIRLDAEEAVLRGRVINIEDVVTFQGRTVDEVVAEFRNSVDDYLEQCAELGQEPDKPFSGRFQLRLKPATHRILSTYAKARGVSLNGQVSSILDREARKLKTRLGEATLTIGPAPDPPSPGAAAPPTSEMRRLATSKGALDKKKSTPSRSKPHAAKRPSK